MIEATTDLGAFVRDVVRSLGGERGPLLVALHAIQEHFGHVDPRVVPMLASELNLSRADVHGVVSFYRDFHAEPRGRVTVRVCRAEACAAVGAEPLLDALRAALRIDVGETTDDGATTLDQVFCLGNCALGPAAEVGGKVFGRVDAARALALASGDRR